MSDRERTSTTQSPLILFDGVCNLCSWSVQFLAPRDRNKVLWFAPIQSTIGYLVDATKRAISAKTKPPP